jgi:pimeloyl-ACP methyl ester carboxylesterase
LPRGSFVPIVASSMKRAFILIPGAGGAKWYWHRTVPLLAAAGHEAIAVDLPGDDASKGLSDYADIVLRAIGSRTNVVIVAQSLGGFTAPLVCERASVQRVVFVNAMIPLPGETAGAWWENTRSTEARVQAARQNGYSTEFDVFTYFLHDVPQDVVRAGATQERSQSESVFGEACSFEAWPEVPLHVIVGAEDRFFPREFQKRVARERLKQDVDEIRGGHLVALSNPAGLVERLRGYDSA